LSEPQTYENSESEDLDEEQEELLPRRPRRRLLAPVPVALGAVLTIACGFIGGVEVEKSQTSSSSGGGRLGAFAGAGLTGRAAGASRSGGGVGSARSGGSTRGLGAFAAGSGTGGTTGAAAADTAGAGAGGAGATGAGITLGEVSFVRGTTLYVANSQGNTVKITPAAGSRITKTVSTSVRAIHPGETVVVRGSQGKDGSIAASSISIGGGIGALLGGSGAGGASGSREGGAGRPGSGGSSSGGSGSGGGSGSTGGQALFGGN
jgi:hypothetical protein